MTRQHRNEDATAVGGKFDSIFVEYLYASHPAAWRSFLENEACKLHPSDGFHLKLRILGQPIGFVLSGTDCFSANSVPAPDEMHGLSRDT